MGNLCRHTHSVGLQMLFAVTRHLFRSTTVIRFDCAVAALREWAAWGFSLCDHIEVADSEPKKFIN